jgi:hypothetical protein
VRFDAEHLADAGDDRVAIAAGVLAQELVRREPSLGVARDDVGEGAAAVDPELPLCHHRILPGRIRRQNAGYFIDKSSE